MAQIDRFLGSVWAVERAKERAGITNESKDDTILEMLQDSKGMTEEFPTVYRPYYVAAKMLEQDLNKQQISEAGDVKFTGLVTTINSLMGLQASIDQALGLIVPQYFAAIPLDLLNQQLAVGDVLMRQIKRRFGGTIRTNVVF